MSQRFSRSDFNCSALAWAASRLTELRDIPPSALSPGENFLVLASGDCSIYGQISFPLLFSSELDFSRDDRARSKSYQNVNFPELMRYRNRAVIETRANADIHGDEDQEFLKNFNLPSAERTLGLLGIFELNGTVGEPYALEKSPSV